jgi:CRP-like cAMP-binding protein
MSIAKLQEFIGKVQPLSQEEWESFSLIWQPVHVKRKQALTRAGETEKYLYFVLEGVQRCFFQSEKGEEATIIFTYPHSFSGVADSFLTQTPSSYFFETLTASSFLRTSRPQLDQLMQAYPGIQSLVLKLTAFALKGVLERQADLQISGAEARFRQLLKRSPQVLNLIPQKYLSSYLGMDPATFSKLLGSVKI